MHRANAATVPSPSPSCTKAPPLGSRSRPRAPRRNVPAAAASGINGDDDNDNDAKKGRPPPLNGYAMPLNGASYGKRMSRKVLSLLFFVGVSSLKGSRMSFFFSFKKKTIST